MAFPAVKHYWEDFTEQEEDATNRDQMESGPPKQQRNKSRVMVRVGMKLAFYSNAEYESFMSFFRGEAKRGGAWFDWTHPRTGAVVQARFVGGQAMQPTRQLRATLDLIDLPIVLEYWSA